MAKSLALAVHGDGSGHAMPRWTGTHQMAMQVFELYGAIFLFGLVGFAAGLSLKLRGRVGIVLGILMTLIVLAIVGLGFEL